MGEQRIRLHGIGPDLEGRVWESNLSLTVGRSPGVEVSLPDTSLSRRHAELVRTELGWAVRDLGSKNGTFLNGIRVGQADRALHARDVLQCGNVVMIVSLPEGDGPPTENTPTGTWQVQGTAQNSWEEALQKLAMDVTRRTQPGEQLLTLLRAGQHLYQATSLDELLRLSLQDAVTMLGAQRGAILMADPASGKLTPSAVRAVGPVPDPSSPFSATLAQRCYRRGESLLCNDICSDPELMRAQSVGEGGLGSVICALLRTPRKTLGVLQLGRDTAHDPFTLDELNLADGLAAGMSASVAGAQMLYEKQRNVFIQTVIALAQTLELRDPSTSGHTQRVSEYALLLGDELGLPAEEQHRLQVAAPLHDIGKIGVDDTILRKPSDLTPREYEEMKSHSLKGAVLLQAIPDLADVAPVVRAHHERWDGLGYPDGLAGEKVPRLARLIAVADSFDALTFDTAYRKALPVSAAVTQIEEGAGAQFDPDCVQAFRRALPRLQQRLQQRLQLVRGQEGGPMNV
jgi:HD-GYP domain-containing protein (c-di-GMP phosphodiesterase class II)